MRPSAIIIKKNPGAVPSVAGADAVFPPEEYKRDQFNNNCHTAAQ
jgi:hypothetical protein